jgi:ribonucleoside-diphosphate reductase alpha chain
MKDGKLDEEKVKQTVSTAIRMLDNVIDINYYSVDTAKNSNLKHRTNRLRVDGVSRCSIYSKYPLLQQ